ncbi:hypothetical protein PMAYCL1PPCAC_09452, partial [Pristionchus mayeri]
LGSILLSIAIAASSNGLNSEMEKANEMGLEIVRRVYQHFKNTDQKALQEVAEMFQSLASDGDVITKPTLDERRALFSKLQALSEEEGRMFMSVLESIIKNTAKEYGFKEEDARSVINNFTEMSP